MTETPRHFRIGGAGDVTITVPEEHIADLRRELRSAHAACAMRLQRALDAYLASHHRLDDVEGALIELVDLDAALGQVGWAPSVRRGSVVLTAHAEVLADALRALAAAAPSGPPPTLAALLELVGGTGRHD